MARMVVIGDGAVGMSAASAARRVDPALEVVVLERTCNVGYGMCGLPYFSSGVTEQAGSLFSYPLDFFRDQRGIDVRTDAQLTHLDPVNRTVRYAQGGESVCLDYDSLVLPSGADPVVPAIPGAREPGVFTIRKMEDAVVLRTRLESADLRCAVVAGGGYVGLEMASRLLPGFDTALGDLVLDEVRDRGVDVRLSTELRGIHHIASGLSVALNDYDIPSDLVILPLGGSALHRGRGAGRCRHRPGGRSARGRIDAAKPARRLRSRGLHRAPPQRPGCTGLRPTWAPPPTRSGASPEPWRPVDEHGSGGIVGTLVVAESFFGALKNELVYRTAFPTQKKARTAIAEYIEVFYNR